MKTDELLNIDCRKEENIKVLNKFLWKVKPCAKLLEKEQHTKKEKAPIEVLEKVLHGICCKYNYGFNGLTGIHPYYEDKKFVMYDVTLVRRIYKDGKLETCDWVRNVYGITLWEVVAKLIIAIYADIKKGEKGNG